MSDAASTSDVAPVESAGLVSDVAQAYLVLYHSSGPQTLELNDGDGIVVGRAWPSHLLIDDPGLSRQHARFQRNGREVVIEDLASRNGTLVDGQKVERAVVRAGQRITLGGVIATVQWMSEPSLRMTAVDEYDRFGDCLEYEMRRGRYFDRPVSLLMLRAGDSSDAGHVRRWCPLAQKGLRPIDRVTVYDPRSLLVLLPETPEAAARTIAELMVERLAGAAGVRVGIATAPAAATTHEGLLARVKEALLSASAEAPLGAAQSQFGSASESEQIIASSAATSELYALVDRVAGVDVPVLITGETGSGKELVAGALHQRGPRRQKPFRALNCGAIPASLVESVLFGHEKGAFTGAQSAQKGLFELANGGTVLLDEIGELGAGAQAALLRVLETKKLMRVGGTAEIAIDVRVVAATHRDLDQMVRERSFRLDLLFRLNTLVLHVPPLRERVDEIGPLAEHFIRKANERMQTSVSGLDAQALDLLCRYPWPGNVRELRNVIERAIVLASSPVLGESDLPERIRAVQRAASNIRELIGQAEALPADAAQAFKDQLRTYETRLIVSALERVDWNQSRAAELLQLPLRTLVRRMAINGIKKRFGSADRL